MSGGGRNGTRPPEDLGAIQRARTSPPSPSTRTIRRPRLEDLLSEGATRPVTVVSGGPGWGKTQLVVSWARHQSARKVAWVSLAADCDDPHTLWTLVLRSVRRAYGRDLRLPRPPVDVDAGFLDLVMTALGDLDAPVVLVLEDVHEISSTAALASLDFLVEHLPDLLTVVMVTRADPAIALHRLRVAHDLTEIREAALAFSPAEARELVLQHGLALTDEQLDLLLRRTEGWAVGLRLAAMHLEGRCDGGDPTRAISEFTGDNHAVADYLVAEVLDHQPERLRRFLLETSIVERVDAGLADALTGAGDAAQVLDALERGGAPVLALDGEAGWYRYHRLFQEMTQYRLVVEQPDAARALHGRAAAWFRAQGEPTEAVRHAIAAHEWPLVGQIVVRDAGAVMFGHGGKQIRELVNRLPADVAPGDVMLGCARLMSGHRDLEPVQLAHRLELVEHAAEDLDPTDRTLVLMVCALIRALTTREAYDVVAGAEHSAAALEVLDHAAGVDVPALTGYVALARALLGECLLWRGRPLEAEAHLRRAARPRVEAPEPTREDTTVVAGAYLALALTLRGALSDARRQAESVLATADADGWIGDAQAASAHLALALVHFQGADRDGTELAVREAGDMLARRPDLLLDLGRQLVEARLVLEGGRLDAARLAVARVRRSIDALPDVGLLDTWSRVVLADLAFAAGDHEQVMAGTRNDGDISPVGAHLGILRARTLLATSQYRRAIAVARSALEAEPGVVSLVEGWLVVAEAEDALRHDGAALDALDRALAQAESDHVLRPFLTASPRLRALLVRYRAAIGDHAPLLDAIASPDLTTPDVVSVPLTDREISVLRLLPTMMSNAEIADELFVSVNTVKAHLKSLYRKLGATSRRDAVERGRRIDACSPHASTR